ncbi:hypothetical protein [Leptospira biflexa]|uniref:Uncharacterized protein n=1 Tax=Leptospira biflexa serovar Patoc (strain Patoc 1 / ATCC 23582 / Paris) TaxID=456481 RepID=B0SNB3_LEPBP|nr:hypothetical protein [Leptospira biflexa]ABZ98880.1 Hypothetical protein LEPBI_I2803 [Leptospira biflexa serovar Patoc strain 'Patoc 1 (Paris)']
MGKVAHVFEFQMDVSDHPDSELVLMPQVNGPSGNSLGHWDSGNPFEFPLMRPVPEPISHLPILSKKTEFFCLT